MTGDLEARALALDLAFKQCHPEAIVVALKRRCSLSKDAAIELVASMSEDLADAKIDGQNSVLEKLWDIGTGKADSAKGVTVLTALAYQYCGWSQGGVAEAVQKRAVAATKAEFGRLRRVV